MSEVKPALTANQWSLHALWKAHKLIGGKLPGGPDLPNARNAHAVAARCLEGQTFGFTWADVDILRGAGNIDHENDYEKEHLIAARIAALLPPRDE